MVSTYSQQKTLIESHIGILGAHWLKQGSNLQKIYLTACFKLGFGYWRSAQKRGRYSNKTCKDWVDESINTLIDHCFYASPKQWTVAFNNNRALVENVSYKLQIFAAPNFMKFLITWLAHISLFRKVLNIVVNFRLGTILQISKKDKEELGINLKLNQHTKI